MDQFDGLDENSPYYQQNLEVLNSPEHQARIEEQKRKIAEFKALQNQASQPATSTPTSPDETATDPRLDAALEQQRKMQMYAGLLKGIQQIASAKSIGYGYKPDYSGPEMLEKAASQPVEKYKNQITRESQLKKEKREEDTHSVNLQKMTNELAKSNLDMANEKEANDPQSEVSKFAQNILVSLKEQELGRKLTDEEKSGYSQIDASRAFKYSPAVQSIAVNAMRQRQNEASMASREKVASEATKRDEARLALYEKRWDEGEKRRQEDQDARRKKEVIEQNRNLSKDIYGVVKDFEKDDTVKALKKEDLGFAQADELINQIENGNEIALGALGTKMARAMGEVGVLTESDVQRYIQAQSLVQKMKDKFGRNFQGHLSEQTMNDIKAVNAKMKEGFKARRAEVQDKYVNYAYQNFGKDRGMTVEDVATKFGLGPSGTIQQSTGPYGDTTEKQDPTTGQIKKYKWNSTVGKYQLIE